jgi:hypothetical protein
VVALDPGDADLRLLLIHLLAAIRTAEPRLVTTHSPVGGGGATPTDDASRRSGDDPDAL